MPRDYHIAKQVIAQAMPGTQAQLAARTGYDRGTVRRWLVALRGSGDSFVLRWNPPRRSGPFVPVHAFGSGVDAPCTLQPITRAENWRRYRANQIIDGIDLNAARRRGQYWCAKAAKRGDPLVNALFGR